LQVTRFFFLKEFIRVRSSDFGFESSESIVFIEKSLHGVLIKFYKILLVLTKKAYNIEIPADFVSLEMESIFFTSKSKSEGL